MKEQTSYSKCGLLFNDEAYCYWWMRSTGDSKTKAQVNIDDGTISSAGNVDFAKYGIRPAMWIDTGNID